MFHKSAITLARNFTARFRKFSGGGHHHGKNHHNSNEYGGIDPHVSVFHERAGAFLLITMYLWVMYRLKEDKGKLFGLYQPWLHEGEEHIHVKYEKSEFGESIPSLVEDEEEYEEEEVSEEHEEESEEHEEEEHENAEDEEL
jgi:hypothetical protein